MKWGLIRALTVLFCSLPIGATAADWIVLRDDPEATVSIDTKSLVLLVDIVKVWSKTSYKNQQASPYGPYQSSRILSHYDCRQRLWAYKEGKLFAEPELVGAIVHGSRKEDGDLRWHEIAPETRGETELEVVCQLAASSTPINGTAGTRSP
jgi:hypothetical protein